MSSHNAILPDFLICVFCAGNHIFKYSIKYVSKNLCFLSTEFLMNKKNTCEILMRRLLTELLGFVMSAGFYNFLRPHHTAVVGVLMIALRGFVIKPTFFNSGKTYSVICLEP